MKNNEQNRGKRKGGKKFTRKEQDLQLKKQLLAGPELFVTNKGSDESLDRLALKIKLYGENGFNISEIVAEVLAKYESKFKKYWFNRLADLAGVNRAVMIPYVKPDFVRQFIIGFVYARFPYTVLRTLRSKNRKTSLEAKRTKLFQHMTKVASDQLDVVIAQVYAVMNESDNLLDFKMKYSKQYQIHFQTELFQ